MSRRRELEKHRRSLDEIRNIMNAMKNLSYMEIRKISNFLTAQHNVVKHIETVTADFLSFYPDILNKNTSPSLEVYLLAGSERGFCGDFNHALLKQFTKTTETQSTNKQHIICIGHKLSTLLEKDPREKTLIDGASVAEEIGRVLNQVVQKLATLQDQFATLNLYVLYHNDKNQLKHQQLLPPFLDLPYQETQYPHAPLLNLRPREFLLELGYHYLFAALYEILYASLMAESHQRLAHMETTSHQLEKEVADLQRQNNVLRQEEIIEEIEVILLSAISLDKPV